MRLIGLVLAGSQGKEDATMRALLLSALAMLVIAGCTIFQRTPEQQLVYERYETVCRKKYPGHELVSVASDGQF